MTNTTKLYQGKLHPSITGKLCSLSSFYPPTMKDQEAGHWLPTRFSAGLHYIHLDHAQQWKPQYSMKLMDKNSSRNSKVADSLKVISSKYPLMTDVDWFDYLLPYPDFVLLPLTKSMDYSVIRADTARVSANDSLKI